MNAKSVQILAGRLAQLPVQLLGAPELARLDKLLRVSVQKIERTQTQTRIDSFWSGLTPRARDYLAWLQKKKSIRTPKKTDLPERWQAYLEKLEALWRDHQAHVAELETQLKSLRDADEAGALAALAALPAARKKDLSQFAKLSVVRGGKRTALNLSTNAARNREWCGALKAQRLFTILDRPET